MAYPDPPITPPIPQRGDRATFSNRVDAFLTWVAAVIPWMQGFVADLFSSITSLAAGGANSFSYKFKSGITDVDPGAGFFGFNTEVQSAATAIRIDPLANAGIDISLVLNELIANTNAIKGSIRLQALNRPNDWLLFDVTGSIAKTGYYSLVVVLRAGATGSPFTATDNVMLFAERSGPKGENGTVGYIKVSDKKGTGVSGGTSIQGVQDRTLNTIEFNDISGASLTNDTVVLPAGSYEVYVRAPVQGGSGCRSILANITDTTVINGNSDFAGTGVVANCILNNKFTITAAKSFKVRTYMQTAIANNGLGISTGQPGGNLEVYSELIFRKVS